MLKKTLYFLIYVFFSLFAFIYATTSIITSDPKALVPVFYFENAQNFVKGNLESIRLISLNIAHGRGQSFNQVFLAKNKIKTNLKNIASFFKQHSPHLVALQEADGASVWSRNFNHVKYLAHFSKFQYSMHGEHVDGAGIKFGTAILSQLKPHSAYSHTFAPSPPTFAKGFTSMTFSWPEIPDLLVDFISVHLDYSREYVRTEQIKELMTYVSSSKRPFIIVGDFNLDWSSEKEKLTEFLSLTGAKTYKPFDSSIITFPKLSSRIDWLFVSKGFQIKKHFVIKNKLSDHFAISAEISLESSLTDHTGPDTNYIGSM